MQVRIPDKYIVLDVNEEGLHLDTLGYNKKFVLEYHTHKSCEALVYPNLGSITYPQSIKVDPSKASAELDKPGILRIQLPVTEMLDLETGKLVLQHATWLSRLILSQLRKKSKVNAAKQDGKKSTKSKNKPKQPGQVRWIPLFQTYLMVAEIQAKESTQGERH